MDSTDYKYIMLMSSRLDRFKDTGNRVFNFRCPYCGDSQKDKRKSRGYLLHNRSKNSVGFFCHNCGSSQGLGTFLKNVAPDLHNQYKVEKFGSAMKVYKPADPVSSIDKMLREEKMTTRFTDPLGACHRLSKCPSSLDGVLKYAQSRYIPEDLYPELYAVKDVNLLTQRMDKYKDDKYPEFQMLVMPFFRPDGSYSYIQCRVADNEAPKDFRFLTLQLDDLGPKLYGENHVDWTAPVYVLEGPIDAMFIDNGVANAGAASSMEHVVREVASGAGQPLRNICMLFDNDYRDNYQVMQHVVRSIDAGLSVVLFDKQFDGIKDINKAIQMGWTRSEVNMYVRARTFTGLRAKLEISNIGKRR